MTVKPTHIREVAALLQSDEYGTPEEMAKAVLNRYDELKSEDVEWAIVIEYPHEGYSAYMGIRGFATRNQATKFAEAGRVGVPGLGKKAMVPFYSREHVDRRHKEVDEFAPVHEGHWVRIREKAGVA